MERRVTLPKTIRMTQEELDRAQDLLPHFPEVASEAELLRQATILGLCVLAAQAPDLAGYNPATLAGLLRYRIMGALDLLLTQDALPALYGLQATREPRPAPVAREREAADVEQEEPQIDAQAAADLEGLGTGFLD